MSSALYRLILCVRSEECLEATWHIAVIPLTVGRIACLSILAFKTFLNFFSNIETINSHMDQSPLWPSILFSVKAS